MMLYVHEESAIVVNDDLQQQRCTKKMHNCQCSPPTTNMYFKKNAQFVNRHSQQQRCARKCTIVSLMATTNNKDVQRKCTIVSLMATTNNKDVQENSPLLSMLTSNNKHVEENPQVVL
jgi:hypothetical protein